MKVLRSVFRRKMRAILTISGIVIGVFALIAMGGMSEKLTLLVAGGTEYYKDKVIVAESNVLTDTQSEPLSVDKAKEVGKIEGVVRAFPVVTLPLEEKSGAQMGVPSTISAINPQSSKYESFNFDYSSGRGLRENETGKIVVGASLVKKLDAKVGKDITIRGKKFEVVGILDKTLTAPDSTVYISLPDAQRLFKKTLPKIIQSQVEESDLSTSVVAYVKKGHDPNKVATRIEKEIDNSNAFGPKAFEEQIASSVQIFTSILTLIGAIALLVGGLSIVNTMTMSIAERTKEIGIRKAMGASKTTIITQFLSESAVIGLIGGSLGLLLGALFINVLNSRGAESGTVLFLLTSRLAIGSVMFALILGLIGGFFPAWRAARLNPVEALRYE